MKTLLEKIEVVNSSVKNIYYYSMDLVKKEITIKEFITILKHLLRQVYRALIDDLYIMGK